MCNVRVATYLAYIIMFKIAGPNDDADIHKNKGINTCKRKQSDGEPY